jgi:spore maturation protein CgeB
VHIFYAAPSTAHQSCLPDSQVWHTNLFRPLSDLGHKLVSFDFDYTEFNYNLDPSVPRQQAFIADNRPRFGQELLRQVLASHSAEPLDVFFSYFYSAYVEPEVIRQIGDMGITTINWYCNGLYQFHLVSDIAPAYNYCLVPEHFRLVDYRRIGANPLYCQEAANPEVYRPYEVPMDFDVTFIGQRYGDRPWYIRRLLDANVDVRVWGPHWQEPTPSPHWRERLARGATHWLSGRASVLDAVVPLDRCGPSLPDDELIKMYSRSKVSLGFSSVADLPRWTKPIKQVRLRDFEAPMSGAFYMVEYMAELEDFYDIGKEIVCYTDPDDLVDKVRYYLAHDEERERIRHAGRVRALRDHTWHQRFRTAFAAMGLA